MDEPRIAWREVMQSATATQAIDATVTTGFQPTMLGISRLPGHIPRPMQLIRDIYAAKIVDRRPVISFEFFPPKTEEGDRALLEKHIPALRQTKPDFCSVTYGAGGSTREKTWMIVDGIQKQGLT